MEPTIRNATFNDVEAVRELTKQMYNDSLNEYGIGYDDDVFNRVVPALINTTFVMEMDGVVVGVMAGSIVNGLASNDLTYQESFWYVEKAHRGFGIKLLTFAENYCRTNNVKFFIIAHMGNRETRLERIYKRRGFNILETHYIKVV